jgi:putative acetyltransferase
MILRPEHPDDFPAIAEVVQDAFGDHGPAVARLVDDIRASEHYIPELSLVAVDESGVIAHVMLSWTGIESRARERVLMLSPMSVRPDRQRAGVGSRLIEHVLGLAESAGEPLVFLEGIPDYYPRFGFERAAPLGFLPPREGIPDEAFMVKRFPGYDPEMAGRIVCPPAFGRL